MACYHPLQAFQCVDGSVVFQERAGRDSIRTLALPCGRCVGCRLERSRQWAIRCVNESSLQEDNCFITLTYRPEDLPEFASLRYRDFQLFMKRLRKAAPGRRIRFFMCGEYGENFGRPHFHACLFGFNFPDRIFDRESGSGARVDRSQLLERLWPFGFSSVGDVTFESAAYVARYCMKKVVGQDAELHYARLDPDTGEVFRRVPEFCHMSLKPGIGARWLDRFVTDVYPSGLMVVNGMQVKPPKYYDRRFRRMDLDAFEVLCAERDALARANFSDNTDARLAVKEQVTAARVGFLKRTIS